MPCGQRVRQRALCKRHSNQPDYIFEKSSFLLWAHHELGQDGAAQGFLCLYCNGVLRRRCKGVRQSELVARIDTDPAEATKFHQTLQDQLTKYGTDGDTNR